MNKIYYIQTKKSTIFFIVITFKEYKNIENSSVLKGGTKISRFADKLLIASISQTSFNCVISKTVPFWNGGISFMIFFSSIK